MGPLLSVCTGVSWVGGAPRPPTRLRTPSASPSLSSSRPSASAQLPRTSPAGAHVRVRVRVGVRVCVCVRVRVRVCVCVHAALMFWCCNNSHAAPGVYWTPGAGPAGMRAQAHRASVASWYSRSGLGHTQLGCEAGSAPCYGGSRWTRVRVRVRVSLTLILTLILTLTLTLTLTLNPQQKP